MGGGLTGPYEWAVGWALGPDPGPIYRLCGGLLLSSQDIKTYEHNGYGYH